MRARRSRATPEARRFRPSLLPLTTRYRMPIGLGKQDLVYAVPDRIAFPLFAQDQPFSLKVATQLVVQTVSVTLAGANRGRRAAYEVSRVFTYRRNLAPPQQRGGC